jgi:hypothetical protein
VHFRILQRVHITPVAKLLAVQGVFTYIFTYYQLCPVMFVYNIMGSIEVSVLPVQYFYRFYAVKK